MAVGMVDIVKTNGPITTSAALRLDGALAPKRTDRRKEIGRAMRMLRKLRFTSQDAFANATGVNRVTVSQVETGVRNFGLERILYLLDALGFTLADLAAAMGCQVSLGVTVAMADDASTRPA